MSAAEEAGDDLPALLRRLTRVLRGQVGLDGEQVEEGRSFLLRKLEAKSIGGEDSLSLCRRHVAQITEGASDKAAAIDGKIGQLLHSAPDLLALRR